MRLVEQKEFAIMANLKTKHISGYLNRRKIVAEKIVGEGRGRQVIFDVDNPVNNLFIRTRQVFVTKKSQSLVKDIHDKTDGNTVVLPEQSSDEPNLNEIQEIDPEPSTDPMKLDIQLKQAELKLRYQKTKFNQLLIEKAEGRLIYTDIVGNLTGEVIRRYKATMVQDIDELIRDYFNINQIGNDQLTEALSKLRDVANKNSERADMESQIAIENSVQDSISLKK